MWHNTDPRDVFAYCGSQRIIVKTPEDRLFFATIETKHSWFVSEAKKLNGFYVGPDDKWDPIYYWTPDLKLST